MQPCLEIIPDDIRRVFVAYSGGLDSSVLLHLLVSEPRRYEIIPWHLNHGLLEVAPRMQQFCVEQASAYGLQLKVDQLDLEGIDSNIEAEARNQRYRLFAEKTEAGDCILTAHHADDQAETFLLNALRAAGSAGLRGIASRRMLGPSLLLRPMLNYRREQLEAYASRHEIAWFNDPSNQSDRFDRNYLRNRVLPLVRKRWPGYQQALSVSSQIQSETQEMLDDIAALDFARLKSTAADGIATLDVAGLASLSSGRCKNLVRYWVAGAGLTVPPHARLQELLKQLAAAADASPEISMPQYAIRIYDRRLFLVLDQASRDCSGDYDFGLRQDIDIEQLDLHLTRGAVFERLQIEDREQRLALKFRQDDRQNCDRHRLKRLFQKHRVPPWQRAGVPQVYLDGRLEGLLL